MISVSENEKGKGYKEKMTEMSMHNFFPLFSEREKQRAYITIRDCMGRCWC